MTKELKKVDDTLALPEDIQLEIDNMEEDLQEVKELFQMMNNLKRHAIITEIEQGVNSDE